MDTQYITPLVNVLVLNSAKVTRILEVVLFKPLYTDRANAVLISSPLLYVCILCILTSRCMSGAVCVIVCVRVSFA